MPLPDDWTPTLTAGPLLALAAGAVLLLLLLIIKFKLHAFLALIIVSLVTAIAAGIPLMSIVTVMLEGFGSTLATVVLLVGLGSMLGALLEHSGGAQVLAHKLISVCGETRAPLALGIAALLFGFPISFNAGLVVMLPIVFSVARWVGGSLLYYGLPVVGALAVMHVFVPPHPGVVLATSFFKANIGTLLLISLLIAVPTWYIAVYLYSRFVGRRINVPVPALLGHETAQKDPHNPPSFGTVLFILLLPMLLIFLNNGLEMLVAGEVLPPETTQEPWFQGIKLLGETPVALLLTCLLAMYLLGYKRKESALSIQNIMDSALPSVCSILLITGAGGMFGGVLRTSGIGDAIADTLGDLGVPLIVAGFLISAMLRVAQGSATVALTTSAGLISPGVLAADYNPIQLAALVVSVAAGSIVLSHFNDSGFWLISRFFEMDEKTTLKTWTVMETLIGLVGFTGALTVFGVASLL
ncbi:GntP family permease [Rothia sp. 32237D007AR]